MHRTALAFLALLSVFFALPAASQGGPGAGGPSFTRASGGSGATTRFSTDCAAETGGSTNEICNDTVLNSTFICESGPCADTNAWVEYGGSGDITGPVSSTDAAIPTWSGTGGDTLQDSACDIASGDLTCTGDLQGASVTVERQSGIAGTVVFEQDPDEDAVPGTSDGSLTIGLQPGVQYADDFDCTVDETGAVDAACPYMNGGGAWLYRTGGGPGGFATTTQTSSVQPYVDWVTSGAVTRSGGEESITVGSLAVCTGGSNNGAACPGGSGDCTGGGTCTEDYGKFTLPSTGYYHYRIQLGWRAPRVDLGRHNTCAGGANSGLSCTISADCPSSTCSTFSGTNACLKYLGYVIDGTATFEAETPPILAPTGQAEYTGSDIGVRGQHGLPIGSGIINVTAAPASVNFYSDPCGSGQGFNHSLLPNTSSLFIQKMP